MLSRERLTQNATYPKKNYDCLGEIIVFILILDIFSLFLMSFQHISERKIKHEN